MTLDLTGLDTLMDLKTHLNEAGQPLELNLTDIVEDPHQPREQFDEDSLNDLAESIKAKGVKTPISVRSKNGEGKYLINHGARRYRASLLAGKKTIPAFIDDSHDHYDQVIENIQRENLTPLEIALFLKKRIDYGDKKSVLAKLLGKSPSFVSEHLSLLSAPDFIQARLINHQIGFKTLYQLMTVYKDFPTEVEQFMKTQETFSRLAIQNLAEKLKKQICNPAGEVNATVELDKSAQSEVIENVKPTVDKKESLKNLSARKKIKLFFGFKTIFDKNHLIIIDEAFHYFIYRYEGQPGSESKLIEKIHSIIGKKGKAYKASPEKPKDREFEFEIDTDTMEQVLKELEIYLQKISTKVLTSLSLS